jgi:hypothetical protein
MVARQAVEQIEKMIRDAAERLGLPEADVEIEEVIQKLSIALTTKESGLPPSGRMISAEAQPAGPAAGMRSMTHNDAHRSYGASYKGR